MSFEIVKELTQEIRDHYIIVTYDLSSTENLYKAAWDLAIGQSVGNPNVRNEWETDELFENHSCIIVKDVNPNAFFGATGGFTDEFGKQVSKEEGWRRGWQQNQRGRIQIGFPIINTDWEGDGIAHLICQIMGGQVDIDHIKKCRVVDIDIPRSVRSYFNRPRHGLSGMREFTGQYDKPLLGGIVKPKTGISPEVLLEMVKEMVDGGVDFIKEDEILANPIFCSLEDRVPLISSYLANCGRKVVYCFCINGDPHTITDRAQFVADQGVEGVGIHINIWSGLGAYNTIRKLDTDLYIHYQKSGDKVITHKDNPFSISWLVLCKLAALSGIDTIHTGMVGGYLSDDEKEITAIMHELQKQNVVPALSCGMHPGLVNSVTRKVGPKLSGQCRWCYSWSSRWYITRCCRHAPVNRQRIWPRIW
jgi:ribulose 1,5-bisphosphate carboxylase large subunit-like protein